MARTHCMAPGGRQPPGKRWRPGNWHTGARQGIWRGVWITFAAAMAAVMGAVVIVAIPQPIASAMHAPSSLATATPASSR